MDLSFFKTREFGEEILKIAFLNEEIQKEAGLGTLIGKATSKIAPKLTQWGAGRANTIGNLATSAGKGIGHFGDIASKSGARSAFSRATKAGWNKIPGTKTLSSMGKKTWGFLGKHQGPIFAASMLAGVPAVAQGMVNADKGSREQSKIMDAQTQYWNSMNRYRIAPKYAEETLSKYAEDNPWDIGEPSGGDAPSDVEDNALMNLLVKKAEEFDI